MENTEFAVIEQKNICKKPTPNDKNNNITIKITQKYSITAIIQYNVYIVLYILSNYRLFKQAKLYLKFKCPVPLTKLEYGAKEKILKLESNCNNNNNVVK